VETGVVLAARKIERRVRVFSCDAPVGDAGQTNASRRGWHDRNSNSRSHQAHDQRGFLRFLDDVRLESGFGA
jgi:hypothetical protein